MVAIKGTPSDRVTLIAALVRGANVRAATLGGLWSVGRTDAVPVHNTRFDADAYHRRHEFVIEVEAGRAVVNNQFLKDLFQACMMHGVDYLAIVVRNVYRRSNDFERVVRFMDTLYASNRIKLPLKGILIVGY